MRRATCLLAAPVAALSAGCVSVSAPDKPIEIVLTIKIEQNVVVRLQQDVRNAVEENEGVF